MVSLLLDFDIASKFSIFSFALGEKTSSEFEITEEATSEEIVNRVRKNFQILGALRSMSKICLKQRKDTKFRRNVEIQ